MTWPHGIRRAHTNDLDVVVPERALKIFKCLLQDPLPTEPFLPVGVKVVVA